MLKLSEIQKVFETKGTPTATYVEQKNGELEKQLSDAIDIDGTFCLITGPSKTGKTSLYTNVINKKKRIVLRIICNNSLSTTDIWKVVLEKIGVERINSATKTKGTKTSMGGKISGKFGLSVLPHLAGEGSGQVNKNNSESVSSEKVLAEPSAYHLLSELKQTPYVLVIDGIDKLNSGVIRTLFQQIKIFVDHKISIVAVSSSHHIEALVSYNPDLIGRIAHVKLFVWEKEDLSKIIQKGFKCLKVAIPSDDIIELISKESTGLPIMTQLICLELLRKKKSTPKKMTFTEEDVCTILNTIVKNYYSTFDSIYERLIQGLRATTRKYNTYEYIIMAFSLDPIQFSLTREQLDDRIERLIIPNETTPPRNSITGSLRALENLQKKIHTELLKWDGNISILEIIEPSFLFYIRWREERKIPPSADEVLMSLLNKFK